MSWGMEILEVRGIGPMIADQSGYLME